MANIFLHDRGCRPDHPTVLRAFTNQLTDFLRLFAFPYFLERLHTTDISHALLPKLLLQAIARIDIAIRIHKEINQPCLAWKHTTVSFNVINQTIIEESSEPCFGRMLFHLQCNQFLKVGNHLLLVCYLIVIFMEIV